MDDFERRLKMLPLAGPTEGMKRRIFGDRPGRLWFVEVFRLRIPLGWAAVFALFAGIAGMFGSLRVPSKPAPPLQPTVYDQILKSPSDRNLFDFTIPAEDFMQGELTVNVQAPKEI